MLQKKNKKEERKTTGQNVHKEESPLKLNRKGTQPQAHPTILGILVPLFAYAGNLKTLPHILNKAEEPHSSAL